DDVAQLDSLRAGSAVPSPGRVFEDIGSRPAKASPLCLEGEWLNGSDVRIASRIASVVFLGLSPHPGLSAAALCGTAPCGRHGSPPRLGGRQPPPAGPEPPPGWRSSRAPRRARPAA